MWCYVLLVLVATSQAARVQSLNQILEEQKPRRGGDSIITPPSPNRHSYQIIPWEKVFFCDHPLSHRCSFVQSVPETVDTWRIGLVTRPLFYALTLLTTAGVLLWLIKRLLRQVLQMMPQRHEKLS